MVKHLYILDSDTSSSYWLRGVESSQWLNLLHPFTDVEDLYLSPEFSPHIVPTMHGINGEGMTEMLPTLSAESFHGKAIATGICRRGHRTTYRAEPR